jgi:hypothetical protein
MYYLSSYVTGSNDVFLNEVGGTKAVSGGGASGHSFETPPRSPTGQCPSRGLD